MAGCGLVLFLFQIIIASISLLPPSLSSIPLLSFLFFSSLSLPPDSQPCPSHIRHMATLDPKLAKVPTCTLRTPLHPNIPLLILQQPSLASTSLTKSPFHVHLAPPPARLRSSNDRVWSIGRRLPAGAFGYVGSGYVRGVLTFMSPHG